MSKQKFNEVVDKVNDMAPINTDTSIKQTNVDDVRPFDQKNMPKGAFNPNKGSK